MCTDVVHPIHIYSSRSSDKFEPNISDSMFTIFGTNSIPPKSHICVSSRNPVYIRAKRVHSFCCWLRINRPRCGALLVANAHECQNTQKNDSNNSFFVYGLRVCDSCARMQFSSILSFHAQFEHSFTFWTHKKRIPRVSVDLPNANIYFDVFFFASPSSSQPPSSSFHSNAACRNSFFSI